jgi:glyoxylate reductase
VTHDPFVPVALRKLDNVVLAPHNGGATWESRGEQTIAIARNTVAHIRGEYVGPLIESGQSLNATASR